MLPNDLFVQLISFFIAHSYGYELKKELQSEQKSLSGFYTKYFSIKSSLAVPFFLALWFGQKRRQIRKERGSRG